MILTTDATAEAVIAIRGGFAIGAAYTAVTPCNANSASATCTTANEFGTIAERDADGSVCLRVVDAPQTV